MRALRIDMVTERLEGGHPEVLKGNDIHTPVFRFEGFLPGGSSRLIPLPANRDSSLVFRNDSSFPLGIVVRDGGGTVLQTVTVAVSSDALFPLSKQSRTIEFLNPDPSLAQVTALVF